MEFNLYGAQLPEIGCCSLLRPARRPRFGGWEAIRMLWRICSGFLKALKHGVLLVASKDSELRPGYQDGLLGIAVYTALKHRADHATYRPPLALIVDVRPSHSRSLLPVSRTGRGGMLFALAFQHSVVLQIDIPVPGLISSLH